MAKKEKTTWQDTVKTIDGVKVKVKKLDWKMPQAKQLKPKVVK